MHFQGDKSTNLYRSLCCIACSVARTDFLVRKTAVDAQIWQEPTRAMQAG
jgi:hypothetical protein